MQPYYVHGKWVSFVDILLYADNDFKNTLMCEYISQESLQIH